jgi:CheY-like chemotaxis protein/chemotaxis signal transduction protein
LSDTPRILLVDDNPVNLKMARMLVEKQGVQVDTAMDGEAAVEAVRITPYQMVLMDVQMPGMDGLEATRRIRRWEERAMQAGDRSRVAIIALTAQERKEDQQACLDAGMDDVMEKPLRPEKIQTVLKRIRKHLKNCGSVSSRILGALEETAASAAVVTSEIPIRHLMVFTLGNETYAFDMEYMKSIRWAKEITPLPGLPPHILGIINARGDIISVVDLRVLMGIQADHAPQASIMITSMKGVDVGFLVDSVDEIIDLPLKSIDPPMITFEKEYSDVIDGEARLDERLVIILNYERIMASEKMDIHGR